MLRISGVVLAVIGAPWRWRGCRRRASVAGAIPNALQHDRVAAQTARFHLRSTRLRTALLQIYDRWTVLLYSLLGASVFWHW